MFRCVTYEHTLQVGSFQAGWTLPYGWTGSENSEGKRKKRWEKLFKEVLSRSFVDDLVHLARATFNAVLNLSNGIFLKEVINAIQVV